MKSYVAPTIEIIELRPEERLAGGSKHYVKYNAWVNWIVKILTGCTLCKEYQCGDPS